MKNVKQISAILISIQMLFASYASAGEGEFSPSVEEMRSVTKYVVENIRAKNHVLKLLDVTEVSRESMDTISADLDKRWPATLELPQILLKGDQIFIDQKPSGLRIASYEPLTLKLDGETWTLDLDKRTDESYFDLIGFLEGRSHKLSWIDIILPRAEARGGLLARMFSNGKRGAISGGLIGALAGGLLSVATGAKLGTAVLTTVVFGGAGALIGNTIGRQNQQRRYNERRRHYQYIDERNYPNEEMGVPGYAPSAY
jgi:hypothetical protein